ncbi:MAG: MATE family efflux transporter [Hyphomicrobiaceae bacterium]
MTVTAASGQPPLNPLLSSAILPTLVRLSWPNIVALSATSLVAIAETSYIGILGTEPLAAMAFVFPMIMMTQMMSSGAMGGGVSSAISRALGAGDDVRARALAMHALMIGIAGGLLFTVVFLSLGPALYRLLGGRDGVLQQALLYSNTFFTGVIVIWLLNTLASIVRGTGNMKVPSLTYVGIAAAQIAVGGALSLGLGPVPRFGIAGVAFGQLAAFGLGALFLFWLLTSRSRLRIGFDGVRFKWEMFRDILKVGALACLSALLSVVTILTLARFVARFGTDALAGYGIGARLEFLLVPVAFGVGVACVPMVGMAIGAGDIARARRVAWTGSALSAGVILILTVIITIFPDLWVALFTDSRGVRASTYAYLKLAAPGFPFFGLGLCLYFASQGSGDVRGPVLAAVLRFLVVVSGAVVLGQLGTPVEALFALVGLAMVVYGATAATTVHRAKWG